MKNLKNISTKLFVILVLLIPSLGYSRNVTLRDLIKESEDVSKKIPKMSSKLSKGLLSSHKVRVGNMIALESGALNCRDLFDIDPTLISGIYNIYPSGKITQSKTVYCEVENGRVISQTRIQDATSMRAASNRMSNNYAEKSVKCESNGKKVNCSVPRAATMPTVKRQISKKKCVSGKNFGLNSDGIWVNDGCKAVFETLTLKSLEMDCSSNGSYHFCGGRGVKSIKLLKEYSKSKCGKKSAYGFNKSGMWVSKSCSGKFRINY